MTAEFTQTDIQAIVPHRFENVLIDEIECTEDGSAAKLTICEDDPAGRDIFLRSDDQGKAVLGQALAEYLALASLCQLGRLADGEVGFFSTITNFAHTARLPAGQPMVARVERQRDRGAFRRFRGTVMDAQGAEAARADIMAFVLDTRAEQPEEDRRQAPLPPMSQSIEVPAETFFWKRPEMCFVSECCHLDLDAQQATLKYVYPEDHPFTKGHFPGNPVMMGITQWVAASDATDYLVLALIEEGKLACPVEVKADISIQRPDGIVVAEVGSLANRYRRDRDGRVQSETAATKRIGFRDMVHPTETLVLGVLVQASA